MPEDTPQQPMVSVDDLLLIIGTKEAQILALSRQLQSCQAQVKGLSEALAEKQKDEGEPPDEVEPIEMPRRRR